MNYKICFDIGGTRVKMGVVKGDDLVHHEIITIEDNSSIRYLLNTLEGKILEFIENETSSSKLEGIALALPSLINSDKNTILSKYVKYTDASDIDLNQWSQEKFGVPIFLENDAKAALMGEAYHGNGTEYQDLVLITFGTGVGSAVMLNRKLLHGKDYLAGNLIGHSVIDFDGGICNCGGSGCLESVASGWSLKEKSKGREDFKSLFEKMKQGDQVAKQTIDNLIQAWGKAVINLVLAYNPECIICGGGIMHQSDFILERFRESLDGHGWVSSQNVLLKPAKHTDFAAIFGLSEIIDQKLKKTKV